MDESTPIINGYPGDGDTDFNGAPPTDIELFMVQNGVSDKYSCMLRVWSNVTNSYELVKKYPGTFPEPDDVGKEFGPGKYAVMFSWQGEDGPTGRKKTFGKEFKFVISEAYKEAHEDYLVDRSEERRKRDKERLSKKKEEAEISRIETGGNPGLGIDPIEAAERMLQKNLDMAIKLGQLNQPRGEDKTLALIVSMQQESSKMMMQMMMGMMQMMNGNRTQPESSSDMALKFMGMTKELLLMKRDLDEPDTEKETMGEKVFNTFVGFVPNILDLASKSMEARKSSLLLNAAKESKEYAAMRDPAVLAGAVNKLDAKFSPKQTDKILEVFEFARPASTRPNYEKYREPDEDDDEEDKEGETE